MNAQEALNYGLIDKVITTKSEATAKENNEK